MRRFSLAVSMAGIGIMFVSLAQEGLAFNPRLWVLGLIITIVGLAIRRWRRKPENVNRPQ